MKPNSSCYDQCVLCHEHLTILTKNQIIIPDNAAAIRQIMNNFHNCSKACKRLVDGSFIANTGLFSFFFNVMFGLSEIKGNLTFTIGPLQLLVSSDKWFWRQKFVILRTAFSQRSLLSGKKLNLNWSSQLNLTQPWRSFCFSKGETPFTLSKIIKRKRMVLNDMSLPKFPSCSKYG